MLCCGHSNKCHKEPFRNAVCYSSASLHTVNCLSNAQQFGSQQPLSEYRSGPSNSQSALSSGVEYITRSSVIASPYFPYFHAYKRNTTILSNLNSCLSRNRVDRNHTCIYIQIVVNLIIFISTASTHGPCFILLLYNKLHFVACKFICVIVYLFGGNSLPWRPLQQ